MGQMQDSVRYRNMEPLYSTFADDPDLGDLVVLFVEEMPTRVANFLELLNRSDWEGLRRSAHQLKGAAGSYGFYPITNSAGRLENTILEEETEEAIRLAAEELIAMCNHARAGTPS